jgi:UDP-N-acetyl-D-mannosaminuronic acid dehydrogenase
MIADLPAKARPGRLAEAARPTRAQTAIDLDVVVVGGCGHVGLPLSLSLAQAGLRVGVHDIDRVKIMHVQSGKMPFIERGAEELLAQVLESGLLELSDRADIVRRANTVILVIGTPIDEFMNPSTRVFERVVDQLSPLLRDDVLMILRSTVSPGTTEFVAERLRRNGVAAQVAFCPERISQGYALEELRTMPQLIGAASDVAFERASGLFQQLDVEVLRTTPKEAEIAKLLTNTWRYMKFAIANEFFEIAHRAGTDYNRVLHAVRHNYARAADLPGPGFAAGPCLLKDTMQLAAFCPDQFPMGHAAMLVNEGLPAYIVDVLDHRRPLAGRTLGILGMAFKGESDDARTSLSYKLRKLAAFRGARVMATDPYVCDPSLCPLEDVLRASDVLVVGAPHEAYRALDLDGREVVDIWGVTGKGIRF